ncbi:MAG: acetyl/propionyl-CoA carboxylase subuit alpha [Betaproteobacteria bacterium]|nr:acetyl/propionyl/methylcrotonyl-CoA carboxylase subunit alpha [Rhodocyclaceae bacterium]MCG3187681.1 Acetyl-/propionyl-coenzyme A carboxylase alpha chain [Rhodocyclaceae bacterium]
MFRKILIANRGEIACRILRTARRMGIATVAVYSDADRDALHVSLADEAVAIGPAPSRESYLVARRIIDACLETGAEAVHPGYGFLSENEDFAREVEAAGIVFIGPKHGAIAAMGDKIASKKLAREAGVNIIPGYDAAIASAEQAVSIARDIGYPVMIKASAGGGGKGLRVAFDDEQTRVGFESCRNEARNAFGDDRVFIEKYVEEPRHIEIQVVGDAHGNYLYLWERECSIQRRHQKVIEEAPSPFLDRATRQAMGEQAVKLARTVGYQSAGTVEFVVGRNRDFFFLEMNTRLQVEHPVTEMITGLDLVELMIRIAAGEQLPLKQEEVRREGWAIECRINAEDPFRNFLPSVGRLVKFRPPEEVPGEVRVDTGVYEGGEISMYYDSMIAKLITHGSTRAEAIARMRDALNAFVIRGISSNIAFQAALTRHPRFFAGQLTTGFIAEEFPGGFSAADAALDEPALLVVVAAAVHRCYRDRASGIGGQMPGHELKIREDWVVSMRGGLHHVRTTRIDGGYRIDYQEKSYALLSGWRFGDILFRGTVNGEPFCLQVERIGLRYRLIHWGTEVQVQVVTPRVAELLALMPEKVAPDTSRLLLSPMPGLLTQVAVAVGQEVKAGETLAVIEAMKMENVLKAERDGIVEAILAEAGASVAVDQAILRFA